MRACSTAGDRQDGAAQSLHALLIHCTLTPTEIISTVIERKIPGCQIVKLDGCFQELGFYSLTTGSSDDSRCSLLFFKTTQVPLDIECVGAHTLGPKLIIQGV